MCFGGAPSIPAVPPIEPLPEKAKKADAEVQATRDKTKQQALLAGGLSSTDLTSGGLSTQAFTQQALLAGKTKLGQ